jgi:GTP-binding protein
MKAADAELVAIAGSRGDFPAESLPEIVLAGRSNVGKSSLINRLTGQRIARIGSAPGTTRSINFYRIEGSFVLVDLPGYGYARAAKSQKQHWKRLVDDYFSTRKAIALAVQLVDARISPMEQDLRLARWLERYRVPRLIVATKADKLSGNRRVMQERVLSNTFGQPVRMCSAATGWGCREIWQQLLESAQVLAYEPAGSPI